MIFETERLRFRRFVRDDLGHLVRLYADPEIRRYFPDGVRDAAQTKDEMEWFLNGHPRDPRLGLWAANHRATGEFIGRGGLLPWTIDGALEIEIAYMVDKRFWRQGYGSESAAGLVRHAFEVLGLSRVIALIDPDHESSRSTASRAGLKFEKQIEMDGILSDVYALERDT